MIPDKRFEIMADYAYSRVPLYMKRLVKYTSGMPWENIPVLTKDEIQSDSESFFSSEYLVGGNREDILHGRTSGSTGRYMDLYCHRNDNTKSLLTVWLYRKKYYGITPADKMCYFFTSSNIGYRDGIEYESEATGNIKGFSKNNLTHDRMIEIYREIEEFDPVWMFIQPSMAVLLCDAAKETGIKLENLRYIEFTGEMLTDSVRKRTEETFDCRCANHYGCNEVNTIAFECPYGNMHIASNMVYVETLDDSDCRTMYSEEGRIIVTSVANRVMPYIRYDIGDRGVLRDDIKCRCGCQSPVLELTGGRVHEYIETADGQKINAYIFVHAVEMINRELEGCVRQFSIVQADYDRFDVKMAVDDEIYEMGVDEEAIEERFMRNVIHPGMENAEYRFEFCNQIFQEEGRKVLWFRKCIKTGENLYGENN